MNWTDRHPDARRRSGARRRESGLPSIELVLKDGDSVVCVKRLRAESDDEGPAVGHSPFLGRREILIVREHERRVHGQARLPDVRPALLSIDERGTEAIERLLETHL